MHRTILCTIFAALLVGSATTTLKHPPVFSLNIPPAFGYSTGTKQYHTGDYTLNQPPYVEKAAFPIAKEFGSWGPRPTTNIQDTCHLWDIEVSNRNPAKVLNAYDHAKDGYDANVDEEGNYMFARFERKTFPWGKGFSYFTQYTQDTGVYVPHNGHLTYEIWGATNDGKHVVHATCTVTHHKLDNWPDVRDAGSMENLKQDPDYKLVESCSASDFQPPLTDFDNLVGSLRVK